MHAQPLIAVTDVERSSARYQRLLGLCSDHGGREYERLTFEGKLVLQLHSFDAEHDHGLIGSREDRPYGNGVLLWFVVHDFEGVIQRTRERGVEIALPPRKNDPDHWECWLRDPDGYTLVVASPDWSPK